MSGHGTQVRLGDLRNPSLHTTSHTGSPGGKKRPGLVHRRTLRGRIEGHWVHCGGETGPHTARLENWSGAQAPSYAHGVHRPLACLNQPALPFQGRHWVLHSGNAHSPAAELSVVWHGGSDWPVYMYSGPARGRHGA